MYIYIHKTVPRPLYRSFRDETKVKPTLKLTALSNISLRANAGELLVTSNVVTCTVVETGRGVASHRFCERWDSLGMYRESL